MALMRLMADDPPPLVLLDLGLPGRRRLFDRAPAARALAMRAGHRDRPGRRGRQGGRAGGRRRRLRHQAVRPARAAGAHQGGAAAYARARIGSGSASRGQRFDATVRFADWELDIAARRLLDPRGREVALTSGEFDLLSVFAQAPGPRAVARLPARKHAGPRGRAVRPDHRRAGRPSAQEARSRRRRSRRSSSRCAAPATSWYLRSTRVDPRREFDRGLR